MKALVTGGGGFLGGAIVRQLLARGDAVRSFSRGDYPALRALGVETVRGDLADGDALASAVTGCDVVFHVAALANLTGPYRAFREVNVVGTRHVIEACRRAGVRRLVFTSSPSVVFAGRDQEGVDESVPYPERSLAHYPRTKAEAERIVLQANGPDFATVALRPHLIWGPGDTHLVPGLVARSRAGKLRLVGSGEKRVDTVYIANAAEAHLLAAERLAPEPGNPVAGKAYFITNGEPLPLREIVNRILDAAGAPRVTRSVLPWLAYGAGAVLEFLHWVGGGKNDPAITRFAARQLATAHWFDLSAARRDLGYEPRVSIDEGMGRLRESLRGPGETETRL